MDKDEIFEAAWLMDQVWGVWEDDTQDEGRGTGVQQECNDPSDIRYHGQSMAWHKTQQWEAPSTPMVGGVRWRESKGREAREGFSWFGNVW
jgi:hypothetical protein